MIRADWRSLPVVLCLIAASTNVAAADGTFALGTGFDYSSGDYGGSTTTDILYVPVYGKYEWGRWMAKLTVPWLQVTGPSTIVISGDRPIAGEPGSGVRTTNAGLGDIVGALRYNLADDLDRRLILDVTGKIKFPTADVEKGLGTGETDYALQADATKGLWGVSLFGTLGYRWLGSSPDLELNDVWYVSAGVSADLADRLSGGVIYDYRQASTATGAPQSELTAYLSRRLSERYRLQVYGVAGFSEGSPQWGVGAMLSRQF